MDDVLYLLTINHVQDETGVIKSDDWQWDPFSFENGLLSDSDPQVSAQKVFCKVDSVTRAEFFSGGRSGLNPEYMFTVFAGDYSGQTVCWYSDKPYSIYRTYHVPGTDYLELYVERKGGTNGI